MGGQNNNCDQCIANNKISSIILHNLTQTEIKVAIYLKGTFAVSIRLDIGEVSVPIDLGPDIKGKLDFYVTNLDTNMTYKALENENFIYNPKGEATVLSITPQTNNYLIALESLSYSQLSIRNNALVVARFEVYSGAYDFLGDTCYIQMSQTIDINLDTLIVRETDIITIRALIDYGSGCLSDVPIMYSPNTGRTANFVLLGNAFATNLVFTNIQ